RRAEQGPGGPDAGRQLQPAVGELFTDLAADRPARLWHAGEQFQRQPAGLGNRRVRQTQHEAGQPCIQQGRQRPPGPPSLGRRVGVGDAADGPADLRGARTQKGLECFPAHAWTAVLEYPREDGPDTDLTITRMYRRTRAREVALQLL